MTKLLNEELTLEHRSETTTDRYNNTTLATTSTETAYGLIQQVDSEEITDGRETYVSNHKLYLRPEFTLEGHDAVVRTRTGERFEVFGTPNALYNPRTRKVHHIECRLRQTTG